MDERGLSVHAPWKSSEQRIARAIIEAAGWILKKLDEWAGNPVRAQHWHNGAEIALLGRTLNLEVVADAVLFAPLLIDNDRLRVTVADPGNEVRVRDAVIGWYRRQASPNFAQRVARYAPALEVQAPRLLLSSARTQWGSCNVKGEVRLNWRLIQAPQNVIDYVIVHELAHLIELNHSKRFWRIVNGVFPGHRQARDELERRGRWYMEI